MQIDGEEIPEKMDPDLPNLLSLLVKLQSTSNLRARSG